MTITESWLILCAEKVTGEVLTKRWINYPVISQVNGRKISTVKDLIRAFEEHEEKYHLIVDEAGYKIVLNKSKVDKNSQRILGKYKISPDRSEDLKGW